MGFAAVFQLRDVRLRPRNYHWVALNRLKISSCIDMALNEKLYTVITKNSLIVGISKWPD